MGWYGRALRLLGRLDMGTAAYVFTVPDARLREMAVATGPCVPTGGRKRALRGPVGQDHGEGPEQTAAFYTVLTGRPAEEALTLLAEEGRGALYALTPAYVAALQAEHDHLRALVAQDEASGQGRELPAWSGRVEELSRAWVATGVWPRSVTGTSHRLRTGLAADAAARGQRVFAWYGPAVEAYEVVAARGPGRR